MRQPLNKKPKVFLEFALLKLRVSLLMMMTFVFSSFANSFAQDEISLEMEDARIVQILDEIEALSEYKFIYSLNIYDFDQKKSVSFSNEKIINILDYIFEKNIDYDIRKNNIILKEKLKLEIVEISDEADELQRVVTGTVTDTDGNPLPGASVIEVGTTNGTTSDFDGNFSISLTNNEASLQVSFVGFQTTSVDVSNGNDFQVVLLVQSGSLDEIVVTGYGTQSKRSLTGSISSIDSDVIENRGLTSLGSSLAGTTPGVFVSQNSGQAGNDEISIQIRGVGTLNDYSPLVIIDGIEGDLNNLNPNDVESISVLKDAASAAIYGSRAANGVVLVKTKRGFKNQKIKFSYESVFGFSKPTMLPDVVFDPLVNAEFYNLASENFGNVAPYSEDDLNTIRTSSGGWLKNPYSIVFDDSAPISNQNISVQGGSEKTNYRLSLGLMDQDAIMVGNNFKRANVRFNLDSEVTKRISFGISASLVRDSYKGNEQNGSRLEGPLGRSLGLHNIFSPLYNDDGSYAVPTTSLSNVILGAGSGGNNILVGLKYKDFQRTRNNALINAYLSYSPIENLTIKATGAINYWNHFSSLWLDNIENQYPDGTTYTSVASKTLNNKNYQSFSETMFLTSEYQKSLGNVDIKLLAGYSQEEFNSKYFAAQRDGFLNSSTRVLDAGSVVNDSNEGSATLYAVQSFFSRVNFEINDKYLLEFNLRRDGSSRFLNDKWGTFPSVSAGWIISDEDFFQSQNIASFLKFRMSWGQLGNANIDNFAYARRLSLSETYSFGGALVPGVSQTNYGNDNLSWEKSTISNFGLNAILNNGISIDFDIFNRVTDDILYDLPIPALTGFTSQLTNAASMENKGWELGLGYNESYGDLKIGFYGQVSKSESLVTEINPDIAIDADRYIINYNVIAEGLPFGSYWGLKSNGIFRTQSEIDNAPDHSGLGVGSQLGDLSFVDVNGDGVIDSEDRTFIGKDIPTWTYGFTVTADYKNFDLSMIWQGIADVDYLGHREVWYPSGGAAVGSMWLDSWTPTNTDASMPRAWFGLSGSPSIEYHNDFFVHDRSYLRLKNLQIGYTFKNLQFIDSARIFFNGTNLLTFTDLPMDVDPELRSAKDATTLLGDTEGFAAGGMLFNVPQLKTSSIGLNIKF